MLTGKEQTVNIRLLKTNMPLNLKFSRISNMTAKVRNSEEGQIYLLLKNGYRSLK
jgi:hypothetical protein